MKTIGLLGGMTWVSTLEYYRQLNEAALSRGRGNFPCVINSLDFDVLSERADTGDHDAVATTLAEAAKGLESAGAQGILICTNTMHRHYDRISEAVDVPVFHLIDAVADRINENGWSRVAILGTLSTMTLPFYSGRLRARGIKSIVPDDRGKEFVHQAIFQEFARNIYLDSTRARFVELIECLRDQGAEAVILGCTEIPMLLSPGDVDIPMIDTIQVHVQAACEWAFAA